MTNNTLHTTPLILAAIHDYIECMKENIYNIRHADLSIQERDKLLREVNDDLSNLQYIIPKSTR